MEGDGEGTNGRRNQNKIQKIVKATSKTDKTSPNERANPSNNHHIPNNALKEVKFPFTDERN